MRSYTDEENKWLRDGSSPRYNQNYGWPTEAEVQRHLRDGEIMRAAAIGHAAITVIRFIRDRWRRRGQWFSKIRPSKPGTGATA